jgi:hypothetical protein
MMPPYDPSGENSRDPDGLSPGVRPASSRLLAPSDGRVGSRHAHNLRHGDQGASPMPLCGANIRIPLKMRAIIKVDLAADGWLRRTVSWKYPEFERLEVSEGFLIPWEDFDKRNGSQPQQVAAANAQHYAKKFPGRKFRTRKLVEGIMIVRVA